MRAPNVTKFLLRAKLVAHLADSIFTRIKRSPAMQKEIEAVEKLAPNEKEVLLDYSLSVAVTFADFLDNLKEVKK